MHGITQFIKEATRTTAETNTLTYYIVTHKKDNIADSGIIPCGVRLPKIKKDPKIVTVRSTKNLNNDTLMKDLNELLFEMITQKSWNFLAGKFPMLFCLFHAIFIIIRAKYFKAKRVQTV